MPAKRDLTCDQCGNTVWIFRNPVPTTDIIIEINGGIVLIKRKNPPHGWALPGGFIDYGEKAEEAAIREAREETGLEISITELLGVYSAPDRDPRGHTITVVFVARGYGTPAPADDAADLRIVDPENIPQPVAFDHSEIIADYVKRSRIAR